MLSAFSDLGWAFAERVPSYTQEPANKALQLTAR